MKGKDKCNILKQIRCKIARENGIPYHTEECKFKGECHGTCPKCEAELKYITSELEKIKKAGKQIAVAGIAAAVIATNVAGCARKPEPEDDPIVISTNAGEEGESQKPEQKTEQKPEQQPEQKPEQQPEQKPEQQPEQPTDNEKIEISDDVQAGDNTEADEGTSEYIEIDGDVIVDYVTEGDIGYAVTGDFGPGFSGDDNSEQSGDTEDEDDPDALEIPTLQQAVEMSSKEVAGYVVGQNRNAVKAVWSAQAAPISQPSTNVLENYDEYWVGITAIHIYFDSNNVITDVKVFIPADCSSDGTVIPETVK